MEIIVPMKNPANANSTDLIGALDIPHKNPP